MYQQRKETIERLSEQQKNNMVSVTLNTLGKAQDGNESRAYVCVYEFEKAGKNFRNQGVQNERILEFLRFLLKQRLFTEKSGIGNVQHQLAASQRCKNTSPFLLYTIILLSIEGFSDNLPLLPNRIHFGFCFSFNHSTYFADPRFTK